MAKNKAKKITGKELTEMQGIVKAINQSQLQLGNIEMQKLEAANYAFKCRAELQGFNQTLQEKYGEVNVSIVDGTITPMKNGKADKKN
tara:strand:+ start:628 stop:891 length:264 start_codon:yes stop_codon:yes gene_type:complete